MLLGSNLAGCSYCTCNSSIWILSVLCISVVYPLYTHCILFVFPLYLLCTLCEVNENAFEQFTQHSCHTINQDVLTRGSSSAEQLSCSVGEDPRMTQQRTSTILLCVVFVWTLHTLYTKLYTCIRMCSMNIYNIMLYVLYVCCMYTCILYVHPCVSLSSPSTLAPSIGCWLTPLTLTSTRRCLVSSSCTPFHWAHWASSWMSSLN